VTAQKTPQPTGKNCEHKSFSKERYLGSHTGDYTCDDCGAVFSSSEKRAVEESRSKGTK